MHAFLTVPPSDAPSVMQPPPPIPREKYKGTSIFIPTSAHFNPRPPNSCPPIMQLQNINFSEGFIQNINVYFVPVPSLLLVVRYMYPPSQGSAHASQSKAALWPSFPLFFITISSMLFRFWDFFASISCVVYRYPFIFCLLHANFFSSYIPSISCIPQNFPQWCFFLGRGIQVPTATLQAGSWHFLAVASQCFALRRPKVLPTNTLCHLHSPHEHRGRTVCRSVFTFTFTFFPINVS